MPIGAIATGVAGIGGALIGSSAAKSAAKTQAESANRAADIQLGMFNTIREDLSPYRAYGGAALPGLAALMGIPTTTAPASGNPVTLPATSTFGGLAGGGYTAPVPKVGDADWGAYLKASPDVMAEFNRNMSSRKGAEYLKSLGADTPDKFAEWHYRNFGRSEGRQLPTWTQEQIVEAYPNNPAANPQPAQQPQQPTMSPASVQSFLENTPGYQFVRDQGMQAIQNKLTSQGLGGVSGAMGKGLARFVTGLADTTYQKQLDNYFRMAGIGQSAANQTGAFGQSAAQGAGGALVGAGNAIAAGQVGSANAIMGGINTAVNGLVTSRILGMYGQGA